jgi:hypothetical protein
LGEEEELVEERWKLRFLRHWSECLKEEFSKGMLAYHFGKVGIVHLLLLAKKYAVYLSVVFLCGVFLHFLEKVNLVHGQWSKRTLNARSKVDDGLLAH